MRIIFYRMTQLLVALIPAALGILAVMNNLTSFQDTVQNVIKPLISMSGTYGNSWQIWRALPVQWAGGIFLVLTLCEGLVGIFGSIGVIMMLRHIRNAVNFERSKEWVYLACDWGIVVWGLGFFAVGGEWFLAWQNKNLASLQQGAALYVTMMLAIFLYLRLCPRQLHDVE